MEFKGTNDLPYLLFDEEQGNIELRGRSISVEPKDFYEPLLEKLRSYLIVPKNVHVVIEFEYFNTKTSRYLIQMFKLLSSVVDYEKTCVVEWNHTPDDDDMADSGKDLAHMFPAIKFNINNV
jgi:hypothetical protein